MLFPQQLGDPLLQRDDKTYVQTNTHSTNTQIVLFLYPYTLPYFVLFFQKNGNLWLHITQKTGHKTVSPKKVSIINIIKPLELVSSLYKRSISK